MPIDTPYKEFTTSVQSDWIDYNGHLNVAFYHHIFDLSAKPFFNWLGITPEIRERYNLSTFALESHLNYLSEVKLDAIVRVESRLLDVNEKRIHFYQEMYKTDSNKLAASHESLGTVVDMAARKSTTLPSDLYKRLTAVQKAHEQLPKPWQIGHVMAINSKPAG